MRCFKQHSVLVYVKHLTAVFLSRILASKVIHQPVLLMSQFEVYALYQSQKLKSVTQRICVG